MRGHLETCTRVANSLLMTSHTVLNCVLVPDGDDRLVVLWYQRGGTWYNIVQMWWNLVPKVRVLVPSLYESVPMSISSMDDFRVLRTNF